MGTLIYESYNPVTRRGTEVETDGDHGLLLTHTQDTKPITESAKRIASDFDPLVRRDTVHVARIPLVIWRRLQRLGVTDDENALNAWLNDPDNAVFRTDNRSTL
jgi:hypothetical protein